jgi:hypothetical protein
MPMPVSLTEKRSLTLLPVCSSNSPVRQISPVSVNFTALPSRLMSTCPNRNGSPRRTGGMSREMLNRSSRSLSWIFCATMVEMLLITESISNVTFSMSSLPASILEKSRISLIMDRSEVPAL